MSLPLILALQAAVPAATAPPALAAIDFDLARLARIEFGRPRGCAGGDSSEILVCAPRRGGGGGYPMEEMERLFAARPMVAETRLFGNVMGDVHGESVALDRGAVSNRAMVRIRVPF